MPAISPAKLKLQTARLAEHYTQPGVFVRELHALLNLYADNTHRPGQSGIPSALMEAYNVPAPVMRQINLAMKPIIEENPDALLALCDALWSEEYLEHRLLACTLLGQAPVSPAHPIFQRLERWTQVAPEQRLLRAVIEQGMLRLRQESPGMVLILVEEWLESPKASIQQIGLRALIPQVQDPKFHNLPAVYRLIMPFIREAASLIRPDLVELTRVLVMRSPNETAYTLRTVLQTPNNEQAAWLTRKVLAEFPKAIQDSLRLAMKESQKKE
jgi:hypothetical protein